MKLAIVVVFALGLGLPLGANASAAQSGGELRLLPATGSAERGQGCGRVSVELRPPVVSEKVFPLVLHEIDGRLPGPSGSVVHRLGVGRHHLKVSEAIDARRFTGWENRKRATLFRYERFKYLVLNVEADTTYRIGARFIPEASSEVRSGAYWEPVVWSEVTQPCR
jgi:hypothetical protein